ncbi:MAG: hypothetical protein HZB91_14390, partial [Elusimicrobia bacterium]|nr:hypothetical protein [Elusimicrobiota bacterium]
MAFTMELTAPAAYVFWATVDPDTTVPNAKVDIGVYSNWAEVFLSSGGQVSGIDFAVGPDSSPPTSQITSIPAGSTMTVLNAVSGTAADDNAVAFVSLGLEDVSRGLHWSQDAWISTTAPQFFGVPVQLSTPPNAPAWQADLSAGFENLINNLAPGRDYRVYSQALDYVGNYQTSTPSVGFSWLCPAGALPPPPPDALSFSTTAVWSSSISWAWSAVSTATYYAVYDYGAVSLGTSPAPAFTAAGLIPNSSNGICVASGNLCGEGEKQCSPVSVYTLAATPGRPTVFMTSTASITWQWDGFGNAWGTVYQLELSTDDFLSNVSTPVPMSAGLRDNWTTLFGLQANTTYYAQVRAFNAQWLPTDPSPAGSARTLPSAPLPPENLTAVADIQRITLSWTPASSGTPAASFNIYRYSTNDSWLRLLQAGVTSNLTVDENLASDRYFYQASALNSDGVESVLSSPPVEVLLDYVPPSPITDLRAAALRLGLGELDLTWTAPRDDVSGVAGYIVKTATWPIDDQNFDLAVTIAQSISPLPPGSSEVLTVQVTSTQTRYFTIRSLDAAGNVSALSFPRFISNALGGNTTGYFVQNFMFDPVAPGILSVDLPPGFVLSRSTLVKVHAQDDVFVSRVDFFVDRAAAWSARYPGMDGRYEFLLDLSRIEDGAHELRVEAVDEAGNSSESALLFVANYAPPAAPAITDPDPASPYPTAAAEVGVSGRAEPGTTVQILADVLDVATTAVRQDGWWGVVWATLPYEGDITLTAIAFDAKGFSPPSAPVHVHYWKSAPDAPVGLSAEPAPNGGVRLSWSPAPGRPAASYWVYRSTDADILMLGATALLGIADIYTTQTSYTDYPSAEDLYYYAATAFDAMNHQSPLSDVAYALTDRTAPTAQVILSTAQPLAAGT